MDLIDKENRSVMSRDGGRRAYDCEGVTKCDKASLDNFGPKDESLSEFEYLSALEVIAQAIIEDLEAAVDQFRGIAVDLVEPHGLFLHLERLWSLEHG